MLIETSQQEIVSLYPYGFAPEGVSYTLFDENVLYLIEHAIPSSIDGLAVFSHLLLHATRDVRTVMQHSLFRESSEYGDEAIVLVNSIEALAKNSPWCGETYAKVLITFEAMGILSRKFHRSFTEIRIPMGKRTFFLPSLLDGLRTMYEAYDNKKYKQFAKRVKVQIASHPEKFARFASSSGSLDPVAQVILQVLQQHNVREVQIPKLTKACAMIYQHFHQSRRSQPALGESIGFLATKRQDVESGMGDLFETTGELSHRLPAAQGGACTSMSASIMRDSPAIHRNALPASESVTSTRPTNVCVQLFSEIASPNAGELITDSPVLDESIADVSLNVNYSTSNSLKENKTINDCARSESLSYRDSRSAQEIRREAADLAERFDGSRTSRWLPKLIQCVRQFPADIRRLAEIDTLYHSAFPDFRGKPHAPGAWFAKRCLEYSTQEKVKDEIYQWDRSGLDIPSIQQALCRGQRVPSPLTDEVRLPGQDQECAPGSKTENRGEAAPKGGYCKQSRSPSKMNHGQAMELCEQILQEGKEFCIDARVLYRDREEAFVVATNWDGIEDVWSSPIEWNTHFAKVKAVL